MSYILCMLENQPQASYSWPHVTVRRCMCHGKALVRHAHQAHNVLSLETYAYTRKKKEDDQVFNQTLINQSSDLINWSPDHRTPSCDSAQDFLNQEDESVNFQSPFVPCTGLDSFLALPCFATSICDPFITVWKRLPLFLLFQLIYACIGVAPFPGPSYIRIESAAAFSNNAAAYIN